MVHAESPNILGVLGDEMERNFRVLKEKADPAPYFLAYAVTEQDFAIVTGGFGSITASNRSKSSNLDVTVRVGSPKLDNYHRVRGERAQFTGGAPVAIDGTPASLRKRVWLDTDRTYRLAAERLIKIRTNSEVKVAEEDSSDDFSREKPSVQSDPPATLRFDSATWEKRVRKLSAEFRKYPGILTCSVSVLGQAENKYFVNTEGTRIVHGRGFARVMISAVARAADGMDLSTSETFEAVDPSGLPNDQTILAAIEHVAKDLTGLLKAPVVEPFVGPAILSGRAAGVFFHEVFGHRVEGHRQKRAEEGQTFKKMLGQKLLPETFTVFCDPDRKSVV